MAILDTLNQFCDATAFNGGLVGLYLIGSQIDLLKTKAHPGNSDSMYFVAELATDMTGAGSSIAIELASDAQAAIAVDGSQTTHFISGTVALANAKAGTRICAVELPRGDYERYLGVIQHTIGAAITGGTINCYLTNDPPAHDILPAPYQA